MIFRAYKNLNDLKKEFHEKIESLTNGNSDSNVTGETSATNTARTGPSASQQPPPTTGRRPIPDDPLIDPLSVPRRAHPYAGGWGPMPGAYGPAAGGYGTSDLDPFGRNTRGGGMNMDPSMFQPAMRYRISTKKNIDRIRIYLDHRWHVFNHQVLNVDRTV